MNNKKDNNQSGLSAVMEAEVASVAERPKVTKRYGVKGLTDYEALIPAGGGEMRVSFTGGSLSGYGVTPATFITSDPVLQLLIEQSPQFLCGRIRLLPNYGC